MDRVEFNFSV